MSKLQTVLNWVVAVMASAVAAAFMLTFLGLVGLEHGPRAAAGTELSGAAPTAGPASGAPAEQQPVDL